MTTIKSRLKHASTWNLTSAWLLAPAIALWLAGPASGQASKSDLRDAAAVLDRYVAVTGGGGAHERIHNRVAKGRVVHVGMDFEDSIVEYSAAPNKRYAVIESDAFGTIEQGTDGTIVWYLSENTGPLIEEGDARIAALRTAAFHHELRWRELYENAKLAGKEVIDEKPCYKIVMTPAVGEPETRYYDKDSGLLVQAEGTRLSSNMPPMPVVFTLSDYKWVDGVLIAHKRKQAFDMCGEKREILFFMDTIEHNVELPADRFAAPTRIQALALVNSATSAFKHALPSDGPERSKAQQSPCAGALGRDTSNDNPKQKQAPCCQQKTEAKTDAGAAGKKPCCPGS